MFAFITDRVIVSTGNLPRAARRLDDGRWVLGLADAPASIRESCGWYPVTPTQRPADTSTATFTRSVELVDGSPVEVWTEQPLSTETVNRSTITDRARVGLQSNREYLAIPAPNAAETRTQVERLTRQVQALIRLTLGDLDGTD